MFVYYYVHLKQPLERVEERLINILPELDGLAADSYREGATLRARMGADEARGSLIARSVRVSVGVPLRGWAETTVPITWDVDGTSGLFPRMEADLVLAGLGTELTQVSLRGSYESVVGRTQERTLLHRIAEATVKGFVDRLADSLERDSRLELAGMAVK